MPPLPRGRAGSGNGDEPFSLESRQGFAPCDRIQPACGVRQRVDDDEVGVRHGGERLRYGREACVEAPRQAGDHRVACRQRCPGRRRDGQGQHAAAPRPEAVDRRPAGGFAALIDGVGVQDRLGFGECSAPLDRMGPGRLARIDVAADGLRQRFGVDQFAVPQAQVPVAGDAAGEFAECGEQRCDGRAQLGVVLVRELELCRVVERHAAPMHFQVHRVQAQPGVARGLAVLGEQPQRRAGQGRPAAGASQPLVVVGASKPRRAAAAQQRRQGGQGQVASGVEQCLLRQQQAGDAKRQSHPRSLTAAVVPPGWRQRAGCCRGCCRGCSCSMGAVAAASGMVTLLFGWVSHRPR